MRGLKRFVTYTLCERTPAGTGVPVGIDGLDDQQVVREMHPRALEASDRGDARLRGSPHVRDGRLPGLFSGPTGLSQQRLGHRQYPPRLDLKPSRARLAHQTSEHRRIRGKVVPADCVQPRHDILKREADPEPVRLNGARGEGL